MSTKTINSTLLSNYIFVMMSLCMVPVYVCVCVFGRGEEASPAAAILLCMTESLL